MGRHLGKCTQVCHDALGAKSTATVVLEKMLRINLFEERSCPLSAIFVNVRIFEIPYT